MRVILLLALIAGCAAPRYSLTVLHTNDIHGKFAPERAAWRPDSAWVGGFAPLSGALDSVRAADSRTIYIDAGDLMTGNPICDIVENGTEGGALLEMIERCGCDVISVGNHEFDLGAEHLREFLDASGVPWVCGNVRWTATGEALRPAYRILERGKLRIGVIGLILTDLAGVVAQQAVQPFTVQDIADAAQPLIDELDPQTDLIILLTHNGLEKDKELAHSISGCDVIVGGHSHTRLTEPIIENDVIIAQAGSYLKNLGVLRLEIQGDRVRGHHGELVELLRERFQPDSAVANYCRQFEEQIAREYGDTIAVAATDWTRSYNATSAIGNLLCDLLRTAYSADFAIVNSGGIRKDIPAGPVRKLDIVELLPFVNSVTAFDATGAELQIFAERQAAAQMSGKQETLQMSGIEISYVNDQGTARDIVPLVAGTRLEAERVYRGISIDYVLISQADKYLGFAPRNLQPTGVVFSDFVIAELLKSTAPVAPSIEPRLIQR